MVEKLKLSQPSASPSAMDDETECSNYGSYTRSACKTDPLCRTENWK